MKIMSETSECSISAERRGCPFYGFMMILERELYDQKGNQCPLRSGYSPCMMEAQQGTHPDLRRCSLYHRTDAEAERTRTKIQALTHACVHMHTRDNERTISFSLPDWLRACGFTEADLISSERLLLSS
jgi:hypothetical protein